MGTILVGTFVALYCRLSIAEVDTMPPMQTLRSVEAVDNMDSVEAAGVTRPVQWAQSTRSLDTREFADTGVRVIESEPGAVERVSELPNSGILSLDFDDAPLALVLKTFADFARVNIVVADGVRGNITLHLRDVSWRDAFEALLEALLEAQGLAVRRHGAILWLVPAEQMAGRERQRADSRLQHALSGPLDTAIFELHYLQADAARQLIAGSGSTRLLSRRGTASADARTNQLFVTDLPMHLARVRTVIDHADRPTRQVLIEARIVEAEDGLGRNLGARLSLLGAGGTASETAQQAANGERVTVFSSARPGQTPTVRPGRRTGESGARAEVAPHGEARAPAGAGDANLAPVHGAGDAALGVGGGLSGAGDGFSGTTDVTAKPSGAGSVSDAIAGAAGVLYSLPAGPLAGFGAASAGLALLSVGAQRVLALELSALESDGRGRIVSSPRVITAVRVKALIEQGTELPYQARLGDSESGVQFRRAGLKLEVTPQITPSGQVMLELDITKDTVGSTTQSGPAINTKHVHTQVQVENGGTVAIGGIYIQDERDDVIAVPGLGSLPIVGALFRRHAASRVKSELMVFITPNVLAATPAAGSSTQRDDLSQGRTQRVHSTKPADYSLIPAT